jgi:predicted O-linked N-acetylglucosamine transferase (SPINDLY family)
LSPKLHARLAQALAYHQNGELGAAETLYREILAAEPRCFDALHLLGVAATQRAALQEGITLIRQAVAVDPKAVNARVSLARALIDSGDAPAALEACEGLTALHPDNANAWFLRGNALQLATAHEQAVASYERALGLQANFPAALNNQGHSLRILRRHRAAQVALERALALQPSYPMALNNLGLALLDAGRAADAVPRFDAALAAAPGFVQALFNRGTALLELKRFGEAAETFARVDLLAPGFGGALANLLYARRSVCDWQDDEASIIQRLEAAAGRGELAGTPLSFVSAVDSPPAQLDCARSFVALRFPARGSRAPSCSPNRDERIRVAYLSADLGEHPVAWLLAGVIERHDASRFETIAVAWGREHDEPMRGRLRAAFGSFIDATSLSDGEIVARLRDLEVDIAVDLMGHTSGQRTGVFAERPAPIQVNFLGYPGTSGAPYMDYLIADNVVIPECEEHSYSEHVVRLPHCYMPTPARPSVTRESATRRTAGLPDDGMVLCAFNNPVKITRPLFAIWMTLLREVRGSVLWLRADVLAARSNLEREAQRHGVNPVRLVFAPAVKALDAHLERCRLADLFLDTFPYNAHATACDALSAGVPVLTCRGRSMAARAGASLLGALGMHELVTHSLEEYAQRALELSRDPARLTALRAAQARACGTAGPLFQPALYCRELEAAYAGMYARMRAGLPPASITIEAAPRDR